MILSLPRLLGRRDRKFFWASPIIIAQCAMLRNLLPGVTVYGLIYGGRVKIGKMTSFGGVRGVFLHHKGCGFPSTRRVSSEAAAAGLRDVLRAELDGIREAGTWKAERIITTPQAAAIRVQGRAGTVLNFCANNYLGLSVSSVES